VDDVYRVDRVDEVDKGDSVHRVDRRKSIKVSEDIHAELVRRQLELQARERRRIPLSDVIKLLLERPESTEPKSIKHVIVDGGRALVESVKARLPEREFIYWLSRFRRALVEEIRSVENALETARNLLKTIDEGMRR